MKTEHERSLNREAKHEVNQGLRDFELSKNSTISLQKVKLSLNAHNSNETFNEMVLREIDIDQDHESNEASERLDVVTNMSKLKN